MNIVEKSAGAIITNEKNILLVFQTSTNTWAFPKGHIEHKENALNAVKREIYEETGLTEIVFIMELGMYTRSTKKSDHITKSILMFLFKTSETIVNPILNDVNKCVWKPLDEVSKLLSYKEDQAFFDNIKYKL